MNEQRFTLDVSKEPAVLPVLYLGQGDKNGTTLVAELYDNGVALSASGYVPSFEMRLPGGKAYYKADGTLSGNVATIPIDETYAAAVAGRACTAYVSLKSGGNVVSTTRMNVAVLESATNDVNPGQAYENGIEQAIADAESRIASAASSAASQVAAAQEQATAAIAQAQADQQQAADELEAAIDALGDISEVAVPLMSETTRGGAMLGSGLKVDDGKLSLGDVVTDSHDGPIYSVDAEGWSEQRATTGKNLLPNTATSQTVNGVTFTVNPDGSVTANGKATSNAVLRIVSDSFAFTSTGNHTLSGCPSGGSSSTYHIVTYMRNSNDTSLLTVMDTGNGRTFNLASDTNAVKVSVFIIAIISGYTANNLTFYPQLEAGSTATSYEPYTGTKPSPSPDYPQEVRVAKGRNLLSNTATSQTINGVTFTVNANGTVTADGTATANAALPLSINNTAEIKPNTTYVISGCPSGGSGTSYMIRVTDNLTVSNDDYGRTNTFSYANVDSFNVSIRIISGTTVRNLTFYPQLELGSTPTPYVPYGHVGLEVRNSGDALVSCTPIPLPSKGWAGGLPDGTADALSVNSAGKWEWTNVTNETTYDGSEDEAWTYVSATSAFDITKTANGVLWNDEVGKPTYPSRDYMINRFLKFMGNNFNNYGDKQSWFASAGYSGTNSHLMLKYSDLSQDVSSFKTWLSTHNVTVLYPLATPTTEHGYIDLPYVPEGSTITIPELEDVGIRCFVPGARELAEHANNWGRRCKENESRIAALEAVIAEIATA